jgi:hypothetical protein
MGTGSGAGHRIGARRTKWALGDAAGTSHIVLGDATGDALITSFTNIIPKKPSLANIIPKN